MEPQARIQVAVLKVQDREYPLYKGVNVIGRNKAATVNIVNLNVSQNHAVIIEVDETQHYISDMNSSNGTYLHGTKLKPFHLYDLNDDSNIIIGNVDARYHKLSQSVVVSNTSIQRLNNTQLMSQSMYACNTQLITDETISESNTQNERQLHLRSIPPPPKFVAEHSYTDRRESQAVDIHEVATQVMTYPERRSPLPLSDVHLAATQLVEEQSAEIGIHDEETQVVDLPETTETNKNNSLPPQKEDTVENKAPQNQENNSDLPVRSSNSDEDSQATNIGSQGSVQLLMMKQPVFHNRHRYHDSQEPSTSGANNNQQKVVDDSFQEVNARSDSNVIVEESLDNISKVSDDLLTDALEFPTGELETSLHEGENPGTNKPLGRQRLKFDSPQQEGIQKKSESVESQSSDIGSNKKPLKKLESDDKVDSNKVESDAEYTEDIITTKKKPVRKLDSTQESDSDTDIECSPVIGDTQRIKPVQKSVKAVIDSDNESDIENKENIENCNNSVNNSVNNKPCDSDSDTEIEDEDTNKIVLKVNDLTKKDMEINRSQLKTTQVDSNSDKKDNAQNDHAIGENNKTNESDCAKIQYSDKAEVATTNGEPSGKTINGSTDTTGNIVKKYQTAESDSDTDIEDNNHEDTATKVCKSAEDAAKKVDDSHNNFEAECNTSTKNVSGGFNESDCIPATQDAFALAFNYDQKNEKVSSDSSEESFKLGLTELMDGSQNSERLRKSDGGRNTEEPIKEGAQCSDMNTQKGDKPEGDQPKDVQGIEKTIIAQSVDSTTEKVLESDREVEVKAQKIDVPEEEDDEAYIMPTQKLDISSGSTESKQFKVPSKKFTFKKKALQLEQSITTMLSSQSDDMYMMPTQKLKEDDASQKGGDDDNDDDVYIAATQVIEKNVPKEVDDTVYMLPTQKLAAPNTDSASKNEDEDVVLNNFNLEVNHPEEKKDEGDLDGFDAPTQVIESGENRSAMSESGIGKNKDEYLFDVPTQVFNRPDDSQSEFSGFQKPAEIERKSEKPITLSQFENFAQSSAKSLEQITAIAEEDRPESLSQIETFIKQPLNNFGQEEDVKKPSDQKNSLLASSNSKTRSTRRVRHNESLDKTDQLTEVSVSETSTDKNMDSSSTSDKIRKDIIRNIESSVSSSKENRNSVTRNKRKKSCDSETKETVKNTVNRRKLQTKQGKDKINKIDSPETPATGKRDENKNELVEPKSVDKSEKSAENIKSPTEILERACESDTNEKLSNVKDSNKTEIKSNTKSTRSKRTTEPCENLAASKSDDNVESDSTVSTSLKEKRKAYPRSKTETKSDSKMDVESSKRKRKDSSDSVASGEYGNKNEKEKSSKVKSIRSTTSRSSGRNTKKEQPEDGDNEENSSKAKNIKSTSSSSGRDTAKEQPVAMKMVAETETLSVPSRPKRGKSCEKTTVAADGDEKIEETKIASDIRTSKRMTRKNSNESEQAKSSLDMKASSNRRRRGSWESDETEPVGKPSARKRTRTVADLEVIPETEAVAAADDNVKIEPPATPQPVSRNKRKNDSSSSKISEKIPKMEDDDLEDFCVSTSKPSKSKNSKKAAAVNVCESPESKPSTSNAPEETATSRSKRGGRAASKNAASAASSAESADGGDSSTPSTPRKASRDLSESLSTPEKNKRRQKPKVVFTMLDSPQLESFIKHLGGSVVDSVDACSVLVTEHVKRSMKLLTAVGQAKPICSPAWIKVSKNAREFLDPWDYILVDKEAESKWDFSLKESLERASRKKLFENYAFQVMATNAADVLKGAIQSCGGKCVTKKPTGDSASNFVVVATPDQESKFQRIRGQVPNVLVVEPEAIFDGVLRQEIRFSNHLLT